MSERAKPESVQARTKMADIARLAGVSVGTVSRALAGSPRVTEETRRRIEDAVSQTGYVVNHAASGLRLQRTRQILVLLPTIANPFFAEVVLGIEEEAQRSGFSVLLGNTGGSPSCEAALARQMLTGAVDGLILLTGRRPGSLADQPEFDARMIAVSEQLPRTAIASVSIDNEMAAREATQHLVALGHRRIGHIGGPRGNILTQQRLRGYRSALAAALLPYDEALVAFGDFTFVSGAAGLRKLLPGRPGAVFCSNDEMAIGAINAAKQAGLHVPLDLSVIGFDDIGFAAAYDPPLTTIRQPQRALGRTAACRLFKALASGFAAAGPSVLTHELVLRASTAPAR